MTAPRPRTGIDRDVVGPFSGRQLLTVLGAVVIAAALLVVLTTPVGRPRPTAPPEPGASFTVVRPQTGVLPVGAPAPELVGTTDGRTIELTDLDGERVRLADYRGRAVWLNFWASWCPPCQEETPVLRSIDERFRDDGLAVIGVSVQETTPEDVRRYVDTYELRYTIGFDATSAIFDTYRVFGLPTQFFIDRDGVVRDIIFGPLTEDQVEGIIAPLLEEDAASAPPAAGGESPGASVTARPSATP